LKDNKPSRRTSLTAQFVGLVAGILVLSMSLNIVVQYENESNIVNQSLQVRGESLGELLASFSIESLLLNDIVSLNEYVENTSHQPDVKFVLVTDTNGNKLIAHSEAEKDSALLNQIRTIDQEKYIQSFRQWDDVLVFESDASFNDEILARVYIGLDYGGYLERLIDSLLPKIFFTILTGLFVGLGVYYTFKRKIWGHVEQLQNGAHRLSKFDFTKKIEFKENNELSDVAEAFNYMSDQLEENILAREQVMEELETVNGSLEERIKLRTHEMENLAATMAHQAMHDPLTGLANRVLIVERLQQAIMYSQRKNVRTAFIILDLNNFKEVNDTMGHPEGDIVLKEVAERLPKALRESDTVGRLGGDEFAVVLPETDGSQANTVAEKIIEVFTENFMLETQGVSIGASIGIAVYPDHGQDQDSLIRHADVAMYDAKRSGTGIKVYNSDSDYYTQQRLTLMADLKNAIEAGELILYYQPQVNLKNYKVESVEALVRWQHPSQGMIEPEQFIHIAESSGIINQLTNWVLTESVRQWRAWQDQGLNIQIAVNLSVKNLVNDDLPDFLEDICKAYDVSKNALRLEITESAIMSNPDRVMELMSRTGLSAFQYSIDDFGTGYSSLSYLKKLRVNEVKIDKSFVIDMDVNDEDATIVRSVIDLTHNLGHTVVAEGVESDDVLQYLIKLECDYAQGYLFSKPVPAKQIAAVIDIIEKSSSGDDIKAI